MMLNVRQQLIALSDEKYRGFAASLIPNIDNVLGVRLPELRKLAKAIAKGDWRGYVEQAESEYFEEVMLQGMVLGYADADLEELLDYTARFVPKIDNWSVCDSFCSGLKFVMKNRRRVWEFLQPYLDSELEYELRFGAVILLNFYMDETWIEEVLERLDGIRHEGYYVKMAVAWALSAAYVRLPERTTRYLGDNTLDDFTYNKALQKITESNRVDQAAKQRIRAMRRTVRR